MSLTLHTFPTNFRAIKALVAAQYAGVDVNVPAFEMGKDNTTAEFLAKSPCGKVPVLDTKDGSIFGDLLTAEVYYGLQPQGVGHDP